MCQRTAHWDLLPHAHCVHSGTVGIEGKENLTVFRVTFSFIHQYWGEKKRKKKGMKRLLNHWSLLKTLLMYPSSSTSHHQCWFCGFWGVLYSSTLDVRTQGKNFTIYYL